MADPALFERTRPRTAVDCGNATSPPVSSSVPLTDHFGAVDGSVSDSRGTSDDACVPCGTDLEVEAPVCVSAAAERVENESSDDVMSSSEDSCGEAEPKRHLAAAPSPYVRPVPILNVTYVCLVFV